MRAEKIRSGAGSAYSDAAWACGRFARGGVGCGNDRVFGIPILIQENAAEASGNSYTIAAENVRYTLGVWNVTIGGRTFETIKCILLQNDSCEETYIDRNGQVVLLRQYEWSENLAENDYYSDNDRDAMQENAVIVVNGDTYIHTEDRISEYVL